MAKMRHGGPSPIAVAQPPYVLAGMLAPERSVSRDDPPPCAIGRDAMGEVARLEPVNGSV
jgi:hypothetical protein